jgi:autotransporter-associated beta strand protein
LRLPVQTWPRLRVTALAFGMVLAVANLATTAVQAQSFTWGGASADYNVNTNWAPTAGAPPIAAGQLAVFDATGSSTTVNVSAGPIAPDSWTFTATSQAYMITGANVNFSRAGTSGGVIDNANAGQSIEILNNIGGSGVQVQLLGNSALTLFGTNTYSGGTTVSGFGTLSVVSSTAVGTGTVTLENGQFQAAAPNLTFSNNFQINNTAAGSSIQTVGFDVILSGNITDGSGGAGKLTVDSFGGGAVIFTGANTYTGGTTICSCGTLQLGTLSTTGSMVGAVTNEGLFNIVNANTAGITSLTNDGGLTTFFAANTASTMTINNINFGETDFGVPGGTDTATAGSAAIVNRSGGFTVFYASSTAGSATITNRFGGETDFFNNSNAGNATIVNRFNGVTTFNDSSTAMNANITNRFGGSTFFFNNSTAGNATITNGSSGSSFGFFPPVGLGFFDASKAGTATIVNNNNGLVDFGTPAIFGGTDTASADHATIINNSGGDLEFNAFTRAGSATIITNSGGAVKFFDFSTGENAQFITNGTGYVDFSETTGLNNDGRISAGSVAGSGTYYIGGFNTLTVGGNNLSTEVSGVIADFNPCGCGPAGPGNLEKVGTGTLTLSGTNSYTGITFVNGGTLLVTGSIASSGAVLVDHGATLGGTGTVAATLLNGGATLAPGLPTALGTLTVNDELLFCDCAFYNVKVTSAGNDLTRVVANFIPGVANLEGTVRVTSLNNSYKFNSPYTILTAQGGFDLGSGPTQFNSLVTPTGINGSLSYTTTDVNLTLLSALGQLTGLNVNQHNVANALDTAFNATGSSGALGAIFNGNIPQNLSQVAGETATGTQQATFSAMNLFMSLLTDPFIDGRGGSSASSGGAQPFADDSASAYAAKKQNAARDAFAKIPTKADVARNDLLDPYWSVWGAAYGGGSSTDGNAALGSNNTTARAFGFAAGADYRISPATLAGFALAGGGTNFSVNGFGTGRSDLFQAGAFVRHNVGAAYVSGALAYGWQDVTTDRTVTVAGLDRLHAEFNANAVSGRLEGGYRYLTPWMGVTPYAAGQFTTYSLPAYAEQALVGSNAFALNYTAKDVTASRTELGVRTDRSFAMQSAILILRGRFAWAHDFNTDRNIQAVFQTLPGASFVVNGAALAHDSALTTVSAEVKWLNGWSAAATFEGEFSSVTQAYAGKGAVRYAW